MSSFCSLESISSALPLNSKRPSTCSLRDWTSTDPPLSSAGSSTGVVVSSGPHALITPSGNLSSSFIPPSVTGPPRLSRGTLAGLRFLPSPPHPARRRHHTQSTQSPRIAAIPSPIPRPMISSLLRESGSLSGNSGVDSGGGAAWMTWNMGESVKMAGSDELARRSA